MSSALDQAAISAALTVLDDHIAALNARDEKALVATLHFPHYRLTGGKMKVWDEPDGYLKDLYARTDGEWHHSASDFKKNRWEQIPLPEVRVNSIFVLCRICFRRSVQGDK